MHTLEQAHQLVELVIEWETAGESSGKFKEMAKEALTILSEKLSQEGRQLIVTLEPNKEISTMSVSEQIALAYNRKRNTDRLLTLYRVLLHNIRLSDVMGLDTSRQKQFLTQSLSDTAANLSVILDLAIDQKKILAWQTKTLPGDTELTALKEANNRRIHEANDDLRELVKIMEEQSIPTIEYRQQLLATSQETVTADILDYQVFRGLVEQWWQTARGWISKNLPRILFNLVLFIFIIWATFSLSKVVRKIVDRGLNRSSMNLSRLMRRMIVSGTSKIFIIIGLLFGLAQMGISIGPLLAGLGIAGFIIGFALQDTLSNFASGIMILLYRPYDVGDLIETNGVLGKVSNMTTVNTTVLTIDNQTLVLPNNKIWSDIIKNVTIQQERRVDMVFGIGYADDISKAEKILSRIVKGHEKVLNDPPPVIRLHSLSESSVDFVVRPWVKTEDYWDVYWDITRSVKINFDEEGISIPFPQRDVHLSADEKFVDLMTKSSQHEFSRNNINDENPAK
jgi:small conductance mechanosensitive channel